MSSNKEAGRLILADLKMFNAAAKLYENEVEPILFEELSAAIKNWAESKGWYAEDNPESSWIWFAPNDWWFDDAKGGKDTNPYFGINPSSDEDLSFANLCGFGAEPSLIWFLYELPGKGLVKSARAIGDKYNDRLKPIGFSGFGRDKDNLSFNIPFQLDASKLADAWMNDDYEEFFAPLIEVLDKVAEAAPILHEFYQEVSDLMSANNSD